MAVLPPAPVVDHHCHLFGALSAEDAVAFLADGLHDVDWFTATYQSLTGRPVALRRIVRGVLAGDAQALGQWRDLYCYRGGGGFDAFQATANVQATFLAWPRAERDPRLAAAQAARAMRLLAARAQFSGQQGVLWRLMLPPRCSEAQHLQLLRSLVGSVAALSQAHFRPGLLIDLPRSAPLRFLSRCEAVRQCFPEQLLGYGLAGDERSPAAAALMPFLQACQQLVGPSLVSIHVGEQIAGRSPEIALQALLELVDGGLRRLGHALVLGCDWSHLHGQRLAVRADELQACNTYFLQHADELGEPALAGLAEESWRASQGYPEAQQELLYDWPRLQRLAHLQAWARARCRAAGVLIECCPTSNLQIGGLTQATHPLPLFLSEGLSVVLGTDDAGLLDTDLDRERELAAAMVGRPVSQWEARPPGLL